LRGNAGKVKTPGKVGDEPRAFVERRHAGDVVVWLR
jgi:hypothetical protein